MPRPSPVPNRPRDISSLFGSAFELYGRYPVLFALLGAGVIVPFDLISRSVLIATANPFDMSARQQAEAMLAYNVFWYVASPEEIHVVLRRAHGLDSKRPQGARAPGNS